jgi:hypothetical protein
MKRPSAKVIVLLSILVVLIVARLMMPYFVTRYVNKVLSELPGYYGFIDDVDIHLYRGAYQVQGLTIVKVEGNEKIPFIKIPVLDLSVEWRALFDGAIVGEVGFESPEINFIGGGKSDQSGKDVDWTAPIKKLMPLKINKLSIRNGKITFHDLSTKPQVNLSLTNLNGAAENLSNATDNANLLPSTAYLTATSLGDGQLSAKAKMNVLKPMPDMDIDLKFEKVKLPALNNFFQAYAKMDMEKGTFDLYSELALLNGKVEGYVKPVITDLQVVDWKNDKDKPLQLIWESIAGFLAEIFENQSKDQFATRVPLSGSIDKVDTSVWPTVWNIFSNAFVKAFEKNTDGTIKISTLTDKDGVKPKSKKEQRKERRERRKAARERKKAEKE